MAKDKSSSVLDEQSMDHLQVTKKGKPRRFVMITKGTQVVSMVIYKRGKVEKYKKEAKSQGPSGKVCFGVINGKGENLVFNLAKEDGFDAAPMADTHLKHFLNDEACFKSKPTFGIVEAHGPLLDEDDPLDARYLKLRDSARQAIQLQPDKKTEIESLLKSIEALLSNDESDGAYKQIETLEHMVSNVVGGVETPEPTAPSEEIPDAPPPPPTENPASEINQRLTALVKQAIPLVPIIGAKLKELATNCRGYVASQKFDEAEKSLESIQLLITNARQKEASTSTTSEDEGESAQATFMKLFKELTVSLQKAKSTDGTDKSLPLRVSEATTLAKQAGAKAQAKQFEEAVQIVQRAQSILDTPTPERSKEEQTKELERTKKRDEHARVHTSMLERFEFIEELLPRLSGGEEARTSIKEAFNALETSRKATAYWAPTASDESFNGELGNVGTILSKLTQLVDKADLDLKAENERRDLLLSQQAKDPRRESIAIFKVEKLPKLIILSNGSTLQTEFQSLDQALATADSSQELSLEAVHKSFAESTDAVEGSLKKLDELEKDLSTKLENEINRRKEEVSNIVAAAKTSLENADKCTELLNGFLKVIKGKMAETIQSRLDDMTKVQPAVKKYSQLDPTQSSTYAYSEFEESQKLRKSDLESFTLAVEKATALADKLGWIKEANGYVKKAAELVKTNQENLLEKDKPRYTLIETRLEGFRTLKLNEYSAEIPKQAAVLLARVEETITSLNLGLTEEPAAVELVKLTKAKKMDQYSAWLSSKSKYFWEDFKLQSLDLPQNLAKDLKEHVAVVREFYDAFVYQQTTGELKQLQNLNYYSAQKSAGEAINRIRDRKITSKEDVKKATEDLEKLAIQWGVLVAERKNYSAEMEKLNKRMESFKGDTTLYEKLLEKKNKIDTNGGYGKALITVRKFTEQLDVIGQFAEQLDKVIKDGEKLLGAWRSQFDLTLIPMQTTAQKAIVELASSESKSIPESVGILEKAYAGFAEFVGKRAQIDKSPTLEEVRNQAQPPKLGVLLNDLEKQALAAAKKLDFEKASAILGNVGNLKETVQATSKRMLLLSQVLKIALSPAKEEFEIAYKEILTALSQVDKTLSETGAISRV